MIMYMILLHRIQYIELQYLKLLFPEADSSDV